MVQSLERGNEGRNIYVGEGVNSGSWARQNVDKKGYEGSLPQLRLFIGNMRA
jgi:hypothetical protein